MANPPQHPFRTTTKNHTHLFHGLNIRPNATARCRSSLLQRRSRRPQWQQSRELTRSTKPRPPPRHDGLRELGERAQDRFRPQGHIRVGRAHQAAQADAHGGDSAHGAEGQAGVLELLERQYQLCVAGVYCHGVGVSGTDSDAEVCGAEGSAFEGSVD